MSETHYGERTDSIATKLHLLQQACAAGRHDLAMSLIESLKDAVIFERQRQPELPPPLIRAEEFFGPDRRRRTLPVTGKNRREVEDEATGIERQEERG